MNRSDNRRKSQLPTRGSRRSPKNARGDFRQARKKTDTIQPTTKTSDEDQLNGNRYRLGYAQPDIFVKTTKALSLYVGNTYKNGGDIK